MQRQDSLKLKIFPCSYIIAHENYCHVQFYPCSYLKEEGEGDPLVEGGVGGELGQEDGRAPGVTAHRPT